MDFQAVPPPQQYGAPNVFQAQGQGQQPQQQGGQQPGQQPAQGQSPVSALLAKAKQLLSSGQISADQYNQVAQQAELSTSGGNMGAGMPGATGAPLNIMPGQGG